LTRIELGNTTKPISSSVHKRETSSSKVARLWSFLLVALMDATEKDIDESFCQARSLGTPFAKTIHLWGVAVGIVIVGEFSGWNVSQRECFEEGKLKPSHYMVCSLDFRTAGGVLS
jgi:hypothetical protein